MIVLDTNLLSELMKAGARRKRHALVAVQPVTSLYTTSITQAEILHGVRMLPSGRRA